MGPSRAIRIPRRMARGTSPESLRPGTRDPFVPDSRWRGLRGPSNSGKEARRRRGDNARKILVALWSEVIRADIVYIQKMHSGAVGWVGVFGRAVAVAANPYLVLSQSRIAASGAIQKFRSKLKKIGLSRQLTSATPGRPSEYPIGDMGPTSPR